MATDNGMFCFRLPPEVLDAMREAARAGGMTTAAWMRERVRDGLYLGNPARKALGAEGLDRPPAPEGWPVCRQCGCWEFDACWDEDDGACWWVEGDLCSHCEGGGCGVTTADVMNRFAHRFGQSPATRPHGRYQCGSCGGWFGVGDVSIVLYAGGGGQFVCAGCPVPRPKRLPAGFLAGKTDEVLGLLQAGVRQVDVARRMGVSRQVVWRFVRIANGWTDADIAAGGGIPTGAPVSDGCVNRRAD